MNEIQNTSQFVKDGGAYLILADAVSGKSSDQIIGDMEAAGQRQLIASHLLPTDTHRTDAEFEALGFVFGDPVEGDPMFRHATLPGGWTKRGSDHDMWSLVVDERGRERASVFYKAAFYDRSAHMSLNTVLGYLRSCVQDGAPIVTDETWATPAAIREAALGAIESDREMVEYYSGLPAGDVYAAERLAGFKLHAARYADIAERYAEPSDD
jgi:hypothetical protein